MKETVNVSLNGIAFVMETEAFEILKKYMDSVGTAYGQGTEGKEIVGDIEARIAELLLSRQAEAGEPVDTAAVETVIAQMGMPDDGEPKGDPAPKRPARRLYRSREGAKVGGVFSGMAAYFKIDVAFLRLGFVGLCVLLFLIDEDSFLWAVLLYFCFWVAVPRANTALQKMEMKGERITASSIENSIRGAMDSRSADPKNGRAASVLTNVLCWIGKIVRVVLVAFAALLGVSASVAVLAALAGAIYALLFFQPYIVLMSGLNPWIVVVTGLVAVAAPLLFFLHILSRVVFGTRWNKVLLTVVFIGWVLSWLAVGGIFFQQASRLKSRMEYVETAEAVVSGKTLYVDTTESEPKNGRHDYFGGAVYEAVSVDLKTDAGLPDSVFRVEVRRSARGSDPETAMGHAREIAYPVGTVRDSVLYLRPLIEIGTSYYGQEVRVVIRHSPEGRVEVAPGFAGI